jgi:uncharacterized membrane protein YfbV (UPF0208 family)
MTDVQPGKPAPPSDEAAQHLQEAHKTLTSMRDRPQYSAYREELEEVITRLEMALSALGVRTGGLL